LANGAIGVIHASSDLEYGVFGRRVIAEAKGVINTFGLDRFVVQGREKPFIFNGDGFSGVYR
jgi:hypothetical protein